MANLEEEIAVKAKLNDTNLMINKLLNEYLIKTEQQGEPYYVSDMIKGKFEPEQIDFSKLQVEPIENAQEQTFSLGLPKTKVINDKKVDLNKEIDLTAINFEPSQNDKTNLENINVEKQEMQPENRALSAMSLEDEIKAYKQAHPEEFNAEPEIVIEKFDQQNENNAELQGARFNEFGEIIREPNNLTNEEISKDIPTFVPPQQNENLKNDNRQENVANNAHVVTGVSLEDEIKAYKQAHPEEFNAEPEIVIEKFDQQNENNANDAKQNMEAMVDKSAEPDLTVGSYVKDVVKEDIKNLKHNIENLSK